VARQSKSIFDYEMIYSNGFCGQKVVETIGQAPYTVLNRAQRVALATVLFKYLNPAFTVPSLSLNIFFASIAVSLVKTFGHLSKFRYATVSFR
jgi:hypothetical protein